MYVKSIFSIPGDTPLICASRKGSLKSVQTLLKVRPNVNHKNCLGDTALQVAIKANEVDVVRELLKAGAKVDIAELNASLEEISKAQNLLCETLLRTNELDWACARLESLVKNPEDTQEISSAIIKAYEEKKQSSKCNIQ